MDLLVRSGAIIFTWEPVATYITYLFYGERKQPDEPHS